MSCKHVEICDRCAKETAEAERVRNTSSLNDFLVFRSRWQKRLIEAEEKVRELRAALLEIAALKHDEACTWLPEGLLEDESRPCDCHVGVAEKALEK